MSNDEGKGIHITVMDDGIEPVMIRTDGRSNMGIVVGVRPDRDNSVTGSVRAGGISVGAVGTIGKARMERFILMMQIGYAVYENDGKFTKDMVDELKEGGVEFKFYGDTEPK